jgi:MFS family permease
MPEAGPDGAGDQQAIGAGPTEAVPIGVGPAAVTTASILDWLDRQTKQTAKERSDREQYLSGAPKSGEISAHVKHINNRANSISGRVTTLAGYTSLAQNIGAFFGIYGFSLLTHRIGRRLAFMLSFIAAGVCTALVFWKFDDPSQIFWMIPLMGACLLAPFGGYAIYFPELFPTRLRSTGTSLCYNVGRIVAAVGPLGLGYLATGVYLHTDEPMRWAGMTMCGIFVLGLLALPFAPETKGQPLPE